MRVTILPNLMKEKAKVYTDEISSILTDCGVEVTVKSQLFDKNGFYIEADPDTEENGDVIIAVGGDGTILHAAKYAAAFDKPILGVNAGKLGFMAGVEYDDLYCLTQLVKGCYRLEQRCMLAIEVFSQSGKTSSFALNDAVVSGDLAKVIDYQMALGEENKGYQYRADGFIVATPTGSTAYSLSAGGPVMEPTMECLIYTPICPHSLFNRSVIFGAQTKLWVDIPENQGKLYLTVDGEPPLELFCGDRLSFSKSTFHVQFIRLDKSNFYDVLYQKIIESRQ